MPEPFLTDINIPVPWMKQWNSDFPFKLSIWSFLYYFWKWTELPLRQAIKFWCEFILETLSCYQRNGTKKILIIPKKKTQLVFRTFVTEIFDIAHSEGQEIGEKLFWLQLPLPIVACGDLFSRAIISQAVCHIFSPELQHETYRHRNCDLSSSKYFSLW